MVQWLRLRASNAGGAGSVPGGRTGIPHAAQCSQKKKTTVSNKNWATLKPIHSLTPNKEVHKMTNFFMPNQGYNVSI